MTRIQRDTVVYVLITLAAIAMLLWVIPEYTPPYPGYGASPALVPNVAVGIMLVMAVLALVRNGLAWWWGRTRHPEETAYPDEAETGFTQVGRVRLGHLLKFMVPAGLLIPAFDWIGFVPASLTFMLVVQYLVGARGPVRMVLVAAAVVGVIYAAMRYGFNVPIPGA